MRTVTDITPPSRRREAADIFVEPTPIERRPLHLREKPPRFPWITIISIMLVIGISVGALFYFSAAKVTVTPNTITTAIQSSFTASKEGEGLTFQLVTAQKIASQNVKGGSVKMASSTASGTITVYNTQTKAQRLVQNTRFATTAGLIFRTRSLVTVPAGTVAKPGSIKVKVYADQPGSSYNVGPTSFTIPGFAGTPQSAQVYGRSDTPMTGGATGNVPSTDPATEAQARIELNKALTTELKESLAKMVPDGYFLIEGTATTTYQDLESTPSQTTGMVEVREQGTIIAIAFPMSALAKALASSVAGLNYQGEPLTIMPGSSLTLTSTSPLDPEITSYTFTLSGSASLLYTVDSTRIAAAVAGKTREAAKVALTNYPEVKRADLILRPFWRSVFPQDPASISVIIQAP